MTQNKQIYQDHKSGVFDLKKNDNNPIEDAHTHVLKPGFRCDTDSRGHEQPQGKSPSELVVDATEGFIPLWAKRTTLKWRFRKRSLTQFQDPEAAKTEIRRLFGEALLAWGTAAPIKFKEDNDLWDFEIVVRQADDCDAGGCVLASSFFPDGGRHEFVLYPKVFTQSNKEQIDTFTHEIGHIFGLRHFFANVSEQAWPSEIFGKHNRFTIMNYGDLSELTPDDRRDLVRLYKSVWSGALTEINGTPFQLVKPYHTLVNTVAAFEVRETVVAGTES